MKDAIKRAAQAMGLVQAPVAAAVENVASEAATAVVEAVADVVEAPAVVATVVDAETGDTIEMITHTFEAPATAASYHAVVTELTVATQSLKEMAAELETVKAALAAITQTAEQAAVEAHVAEMAARKEAVVAALGTERADAFMVAVEGMDKATFTSVMAAMNAKAEVEADKPEFKEVGVDAQADVDALVAEADQSGTGAILKAKYQQNVAK